MLNYSTTYENGYITLVPHSYSLEPCLIIRYISYTVLPALVTLPYKRVGLLRRRTGSRRRRPPPGPWG